MTYDNQGPWISHSNSLLGDVIQLSTELAHSFSQVLTAVAALQRFLSRSDARLHRTTGMLNISGLSVGYQWAISIKIIKAISTL